MLCQRDVLKNFEIFTGYSPVLKSLFNNLIKGDSNTVVLQNTYFEEHLRPAASDLKKLECVLNAYHRCYEETLQYLFTFFRRHWNFTVDLPMC